MPTMGPQRLQSLEFQAKKMISIVLVRISRQGWSETPKVP